MRRYFIPHLPKIPFFRVTGFPKKLIGATFVGFSGSYWVANSLDRESYAWECFNNRNPGLTNTFWSWVVLVSIASMWQFAKTEFYFNYFARLVEWYLTNRYLVSFEKNITPQGEQRVYFRGENRKDAESVLENNRGVIFTHPAAPHFILPYVSDTTLIQIPRFYSKKKLGSPPGTTGSVVSITNKLDVTHLFGDAVLVLVPDNVASTAPHCTKKRFSAEREHVVAGVHRNAVLGIAYLKSDTYYICDFKLNPNFSGDLKKLDLDEQMRRLVNFLPEGDEKTILLSRIKPGVNYSDEFVERCVSTPEEHAEITHKKLKEHVGNYVRLFRPLSLVARSLDNDVDNAFKM